MKAEIDRKSGFCFGVQNAIAVAEEALGKGEQVFSLGPIVHNDKEVERLMGLGLVTIDHKKFRKLKNARVLIRAHGEPPETYRIARENNITIIEATCPMVSKLQSRIKNTWINKKEENGQIVIFGKLGHAEVNGLMGQIDNSGILITDPRDLSKIDVTKPVWLFAQTTMNTINYSALVENIKSEMIKKGLADPEKNLHVHDTICRQVSDREPSLREFARKHDIIIFVSGKDSSNGKMLYAISKEINPDTYFVSSPDEIDISWFKNKRSAGICGATSTPKWLIEKVYGVVSSI
jgi:4-hydroxy-3-methylbut-2-enyl diphosphate reductase